MKKSLSAHAVKNKRDRVRNYDKEREGPAWPSGFDPHLKMCVGSRPL